MRRRLAVGALLAGVALAVWLGGPIFATLLTLSMYVNWVGIGAMCAEAGIVNRRELTNRDVRLRVRFGRAMGSRRFWWAFWISFWAMIANNVLPLYLFWERPFGVALAAVAIGWAFSLPAIPFRLWLWHIRQDVREEVAV